MRLQFDAENVRLYEGENQNREDLMEDLAALATGTYVGDIKPVEDGQVLATVSA